MTLPWKQAAKQLRRVVGDQAKLMRLAKLDNTSLLKAGPDGRGAFSFEFRTKMAGIMAASFRDTLEATPGAKNYVEMTFLDPLDVELRVLILRPGGKSPHTMLEEAKVRILELESAAVSAAEWRKDDPRLVFNKRGNVIIASAGRAVRASVETHHSWSVLLDEVMGGCSFVGEREDWPPNWVWTSMPTSKENP